MPVRVCLYVCMPVCLTYQNFPFSVCRLGEDKGAKGQKGKKKNKKRSRAREPKRRGVIGLGAHGCIVRCTRCASGKRVVSVRCDCLGCFGGFGFMHDELVAWFSGLARYGSAAPVSSVHARSAGLQAIECVGNEGRRQTRDERKAGGVGEAGQAILLLRTRIVVRTGPATSAAEMKGRSAPRLLAECEYFAPPACLLRTSIARSCAPNNAGPRMCIER